MACGVLLRQYWSEGYSGTGTLMFFSGSGIVRCFPSAIEGSCVQRVASQQGSEFVSPVDVRKEESYDTSLNNELGLSITSMSTISSLI